MYIYIYIYVYMYTHHDTSCIFICLFVRSLIHSNMIDLLFYIIYTSLEGNSDI